MKDCQRKLGGKNCYQLAGVKEKGEQELHSSNQLLYKTLSTGDMLFNGTALIYILTILLVHHLRGVRCRRFQPLKTLDFFKEMTHMH